MTRAPLGTDTPHVRHAPQEPKPSGRSGRFGVAIVLAACVMLAAVAVVRWAFPIAQPKPHVEAGDDHGTESADAPVLKRTTQHKPDGLSTDAALVARGRKLFSIHGCVACHREDGTSTSGVPPLAGIFGSTVELTDGRSVVVDRDYLSRAIAEPSAEIVTGFFDQMPRPRLKDGELDALLAFVMSLSRTPDAEPSTP